MYQCGGAPPASDMDTARTHDMNNEDFHSETLFRPSLLRRQKKYVHSEKGNICGEKVLFLIREETTGEKSNV